MEKQVVAHNFRGEKDLVKGFLSVESLRKGSSIT